jgi:hypothetical protein
MGSLKVDIFKGKGSSLLKYQRYAFGILVKIRIVAQTNPSKLFSFPFSDIGGTVVFAF